MANTVVFVLSGLIIASRIYNSEHTTESLIQPRDYGYAILLWVYLTVRSKLRPGSDLPPLSLNLSRSPLFIVSTIPSAAPVLT